MILAPLRARTGRVLSVAGDLSRDLTHMVRARRAEGVPAAESGRTVIYTAAIGDYTSLPRVPAPDANLDFVCFTDRPTRLRDPWRVLPVETALLDHKLTTGFLKAQPDLLFPDHDVSCWVDSTHSSIRLTAHRIESVLGPGVWSIRPHDIRTSVLDEIEVVRRLGMESHERLDMTADVISSFQNHHGPLPLLWGGFIVRRHHHPRVRAAGLTWWSYMLSLSRRDQLVLGLALHQADVRWVDAGAQVQEWLSADRRYDVRRRRVDPSVMYEGGGLPRLAGGWPSPAL